MKKILAIILAVTLIASLSTIVSADIDLVNDDITISIDKAGSAPVIDGKLDADFYGKINTTANDYYIYGGDEYDSFSTSNLPDFYMSYDANNVYFFLSSTASQYYYCDHEVDDTGNIWNQSCIQISIVPNRDTDAGDRLEIGLARNSSSGDVLRNVWNPGGEEFSDLGVQGTVALDGGNINYEAAIPWSAFGMSGAGSFAMNFIYGFSDDGSRFGVEYASGMNASKDPSLHANVNITDNVLEPAAVVVADDGGADGSGGADDSAAGGAGADAGAVTQPRATRTGDAGTITLAIVMMVAAAGIVIFRRKIAVK